MSWATTTVIMGKATSPTTLNFGSRIGDVLTWQRPIFPRSRQAGRNRRRHARIQLLVVLQVLLGVGSLAFGGLLPLSLLLLVWGATLS